MESSAVSESVLGACSIREVEEVEARKGLSAYRGISRIALFFVLIGIIAVFANATITYGLRHMKTSTYGALNQVIDGKVNADIIISGSSRAAYHYDPRVIQAVTNESAFNLGRNGSQTDVQLAVLKAYLEHNQKPKLIIHNLDSFSFVMTQEVYDPALYVPYLRDEALYKPLSAIDSGFRLSRYIPLYGYVVEDMNFNWIMGLRSLAGMPPKETYFQGFSPQARVWTDDFEKYKKSNPNGVQMAIEPAGIETVRQLIRLCNDNGIKLVLVYSPEYSEMQAMTRNRAQIFAEFRSLANENHVDFWDFSDWKHSDDTSYFYNSQHLNARGAELFSHDLAVRIKSYLGQESQTSLAMSRP